MFLVWTWGGVIFCRVEPDFLSIPGGLRLWRCDRKQGQTWKTWMTLQI
jgi:hypothetical protein